jgi:chemotaxis signal transduction protein
MSPVERNLAHVASELRSTFDASFAKAHAAELPPELDLLEIRVAEQGYALRLSQVLAVHTDRKLVPVPGPRPELLGVVGLRGVVTPVYDLRLLLGYQANKPPRFVAEVRARAPFAVAFELFERHLRVAESDVTLAIASTNSKHEFAAGGVKSASGLLSLLDLSAIFQEVTSGSRRPRALEREEGP